jgi:hypothetical protein
MLYGVKEDQFKKAFGESFAQLEAADKSELDPSVWKPKY